VRQTADPSAHLFPVSEQHEPLRVRLAVHPVTHPAPIVPRHAAG